MTLYPKIQLSRLREIGWKLWDPIGLAHDDGSWNEACADEYDAYLLRVVNMLMQNSSTDEAANYLLWAATHQMGLSFGDTDASAATVRAISQYLNSLPDDPKTIG